jgi:hypothetical protein
MRTRWTADRAVIPHLPRNQEGHRADRTLGSRSVVAVEAMQTAEELGLEAIHLTADAHQVVAECAVGELIDRLLSEVVNVVRELIHRCRRRRGHA